MKKLATLFLLLALCMGMNCKALDITVVDKVEPTDEMFMDMAVTAAKKSVASGGVPSGAVIILNGAWRSTGTPEGDKTAEETAIAKSRLSKLANASVYTINEPTTAIVNFLNSLGVTAIYFANPRDAVVAAGVYPASAYDDSAIGTLQNAAPMYRLPFSDAEAMLKK